MDALPKAVIVCGGREFANMCHIANKAGVKVEKC